MGMAWGMGGHKRKKQPYCINKHWQSVSAFYPHNSNPRPASAAALLRQELAATSAAGAFDADSSGSAATAMQWNKLEPNQIFEVLLHLSREPSG